MKDMIRITDYSAREISEIFSIADDINSEKYKGILAGKTVVMFFPNNSIRTRVTFENKQIWIDTRLLGNFCKKNGAIHE